MVSPVRNIQRWFGGAWEATEGCREDYPLQLWMILLTGDPNAPRERALHSLGEGSEFIFSHMQRILTYPLLQVLMRGTREISFNRDEIVVTIIRCSDMIHAEARESQEQAAAVLLF
ncbi:hypothetical protein BX666DRAFT_1878184 [Dichotomocladium elegans]|nr:hypothetical protein BX666DRAFT_1878184 [Dichotomocladium elegans]